MRIVVIGGTGLIGTKLVRALQGRGHDVVAASPTTGVNTITRIGLATALAGARVVVDVADAPSFDDDAVLEYFVTSGRNLASAEATAGVSHHVALTVVGADRLPHNGYMRAKVAQEALVRAEGIPYTILRSTQSFELMRTVADAATDGGVVRISPALVQPVAAEDIADTLADVATAAPADGIEELAGPGPIGLADLVAQFLRAQHDARRVEATPGAPYYGSRLDDETLRPRQPARLGPTTFADWLQRTVASSATSPSREVTPTRSVTATRSSRRELTPSFVNTLRRWYSTVRGLMNSWLPISWLVCPAAVSRAICVSCAVSTSGARPVRLRTVSPVAASSRRARSANAAAPMSLNAS